MIHVFQFYKKHWKIPKILLPIILLTIIIYGCSPKSVNLTEEKPDLEMDVINDLLPELIPEHPPCMPAPNEGESTKEYDLRLKAFYQEVDSVGKKVEIVSLLTKLDSNRIEYFRQMGKLEIVQCLLNAPKNDRRIDSTVLKNISAIKTILVNAPRETEGAGLTDCYTLGQLNISRVGSNEDSTKAAFNYYVDNGSCFIEHAGIISTELKNGKWQIMKQNYP